MRYAALALLLLVSPCVAVEFDFATKLLDLDGNQYKDCAKLKVDAAGKPTMPAECDEWTYHTLGLIAFSALEKPVEGRPATDTGALVKQAQRGNLARKVYPGKNDPHMVDLSAPEVTLIGDEVAKLNLRSVEFLKFMELLDPARIKP